jgi:4-hydroxy-tetrahydrodipicolinate synthase
MHATTRTPLAGVLPILHTPFDPAGEPDLESFRREIDFCIASGVDAVVFPSLASEYFALDDEERRRLASALIDGVGGRVPVVIGVSSVTGSRAASLAEHAAGIGADAVLALPPYPREASLAGVIAYYAGIAEAAPSLPIIVQNPKPPAGLPFSGDAMGKLLEAVSNVRYVKEEAVPSGTHISELLHRFGSRLDGVFAGFFGLTQVVDARRGACGVMPGVAVIELQVAIQRDIRAGNWEQARARHTALLPLLHTMSLYPVSMDKELMHRRGLFATTVARDPQAISLTDDDIDELEFLLGAVTLPVIT